jgi:GTPase involved in cell partitioning and DNA repair
MKLLIGVFLTLTFLNANEVERIQDIVRHMSQLKQSYTKCQGELNKYKRLLEDEKAKNALLLSKIEKYNEKVSSIDKKINQKNIELAKTDKAKVSKEESKPQNKEEKIEIETFEPSSFRLNVDSFIYSRDTGKSIDKWEKGTSFTSNKKAANWIKITGYFVNKKWKKAKKDMWIKSEYVDKRK